MVAAFAAAGATAMVAAIAEMVSKEERMTSTVALAHAPRIGGSPARPRGTVAHTSDTTSARPATRSRSSIAGSARQDGPGLIEAACLAAGLTPEGAARADSPAARRR